ncbi:MAG: hypothetical protein M3457_15715 [Chloroflexota bacterium]|nr:hypothetical protein [Chloroflexota bacterium]
MPTPTLHFDDYSRSTGDVNSGEPAPEMDETNPVIVFPIVCSMLSALCAAVLFRDALIRPRPDKIMWTIAFVMFALAAGADAAGIAFGWSSWLAKLYYATGPALVVAFLAIGQLYLLFPLAMRRFGVGITLLVTALWVSLVVNAPIDHPRLAEDGWDAIERGTEMVAVTVLINSLGTAIIVGGTAWSVWRFWRRGSHRHRMIGCALICAGTLAVAAGGSLTRFGHYEYLYIAMAIGVGMIFGGVLVSRRPDRVAAETSITAIDPTGTPTCDTVLANASGLAYLQDLLLTRDDAGIDRICTEWSVPREAAAVLSRSDARRAWRLRLVLSSEAVSRFDGLPVAARRQVTALYHDVLIWERPGREEIADIVTSPEPVSAARQA